MKTLDNLIETFNDRICGNRKYYGSWKDDLYDAVRYLSEYRDHLKIEEERRRHDDMYDALRYSLLCHEHNQAKLSWLQLQKMFGKPVYFVLRDDKSLKGWIILHELHISACGNFVISTDDGCYPLADYDFYEREYA